MNRPYTTRPDAPPMSPWQQERSQPELQPVEHPTVLGCDMPDWCAGVLLGAAVCGPVLWLVGALG